MHPISCDLILPKSENSSLLHQFSFGSSGFKSWICYLSCMCGFCSVPLWSLPWLDTKQNPTKVLSNSPINFPCTCTSLPFSATAIVPFFSEHWLQPLSVYRSHDHARPKYIFIDSKEDRRQRKKVGSQSPVSIPPCKRKEWAVGMRHWPRQIKSKSGFFLPKCGCIQLSWNFVTFPKSHCQVICRPWNWKPGQNTSTETKLFHISNLYPE